MLMLHIRMAFGMLAVALDDFTWHPAWTLAENLSQHPWVCVLFLRLSEVPVLGSISIRFRSCRVRSSIFADAPINALACKWLESIDQCALLGLPAVAFWFWAQGLSGMHYKLMQLYTRFSCHCGLGWSFCNTLYCFLPSAPSPAMVRYTPANPEPKKAGDHRSFASQAHCYHG